MADKKTKTITVGGGAEYAKVADRIKEFRADCPNGDIKTKPIEVNGQLVFKATVVKDRADDSSPRATAHAQTTKAGDKAFEKLETIAVGRALANLGYMANGEIATSEEMEEFAEYKNEKLAPVIELINDAKTLKDLLKINKEHSGLGSDFTALLTKKKNELETA